MAANASRMNKLIAALKQALPDASKKLAAARRVPGIKLDFAGLTRQLSNAQAAVADADNDLSGGNFASALQKANAVQDQLTAAQKTVSDAIQVATGRKK